MNPGIVTPGDLASFPESIRHLLEIQLTGISFLDIPTGYAFDVYIEPHAIGFQVISVPEVPASMLCAVCAVLFYAVARRRVSLIRYN